MTKLTRREFLTTLAAGGVAVASSSWLVDRLFAMVEEGALPAPRGAGVETWVPTLCRLCPAACGIRVRLVDGLPVGLEGNRTDPVSAGGLCPAGFALLQELVHPDRLRSPLRRVGPRGSAKWAPISWDQALEEMAAALRRLREQGRPQAFAILEGGDSPLTQFWIERVLRAFGSPNLISVGAPEPWRSAWAYVAGAERTPAADLAHADFILSFGHELFETDGHPVWQSKVWGRLRGTPSSSGATLAYVGPRLSPTAARADVWAAVRPGTESTTALGLIYILVMEGLVDRSFLGRWTRGWDWPRGGSGGREGFEEFIRRRYNPEEVSRVTGLPVSQLFRLGRAFGLSRQPIALVGSPALSESEGLASAMAVIALNLAVGAVGRPGGYVTRGSAPLDLPPPVEPDAVARRGLDEPRVDGAGASTLPVVRSSPLGLATALAAGRPYPLEFLFVHGVNPVHEWPGGHALGEVLAKAGFVVVMGRIADDTAQMADLVLPEASSLESWQIVSSPPGIPFDYAGLQQPAIRPLYQARSFEDVWFALARAVGGPVAAAVPAGAYAEWLPEAASGLFRAGRGTLAGGVFHERIADFMQTRGWKVPGPASLQGFWEEYRRSGAWVDVPEPGRTPHEVLMAAERFDFWPPRLLEDLTKLAAPTLPAEALYASRGDVMPERAAGIQDDRHALRLLLFDTNTLWAGRTAATPYMLEMSGHREDISWDSWIEIHPETARRRGIAEGERARVESPYGSLVVRTRIAAVVPPDAVAMPRGLGHRHLGRFASGVGVNPMALVAPRVDAWTGAAVLATRVRVSRAGD